MGDAMDEEKERRQQMAGVSCCGGHMQLVCVAALLCIGRSALRAARHSTDAAQVHAQPTNCNLPLSRCPLFPAGAQGGTGRHPARARPADCAHDCQVSMLGGMFGWGRRTTLRSVPRLHRNASCLRASHACLFRYLACCSAATGGLTLEQQQAMLEEARQRAEAAAASGEGEANGGGCSCVPQQAGAGFLYAALLFPVVTIHCG